METFLARNATSVAVARRAVADVLGDRVSLACVKQTQAIVSELVTNALQHGQGTPRLAVTRDGRRVRVEIGDDGPALGAVRATSGSRGLVVVDGLASRWGLHAIPGDGKTMWAELDLNC